MRHNLDENLKIDGETTTFALSTTLSAIGAVFNKATTNVKEALMVVLAGLCSGTTVSAILQEGTASNGTFNAVAGAAITINATNDNGVVVGRVNLEKRLQFLRIRVKNGAGAAAKVAACLILAQPGYGSPLSQKRSVAFSV